jgi:hypothetical protein
MGYVTRAAALPLGVTLVSMPAFSGDRGEIRRASAVTLKGVVVLARIALALASSARAASAAQAEAPAPGPHGERGSYQVVALINVFFYSALP